MADKQYKYEIDKGRIVSRQRIHQLNNPEQFKALQKRYRDKNKEKIAEQQKQWHNKFKKEHGMSYYQWRRRHDDKG